MRTDTILHNKLYITLICVVTFIVITLLTKPTAFYGILYMVLFLCIFNNNVLLPKNILIYSLIVIVALSIYLILQQYIF